MHLVEIILAQFPHLRQLENMPFQNDRLGWQGVWENIPNHLFASGGNRKEIRYENISFIDIRTVWNWFCGGRPGGDQVCGPDIVHNVHIVARGG